MNIFTGKTQLWSTLYWCVRFTFEEGEYDEDVAWAMRLPGRGLVPGVLMGAEILAGRATIGGRRTFDGHVTIRATVMPLKKDGSFSVKTETIDFEESDSKRFARLPEQVQDAYRTFCQSVDEVLRREEEIDEEERRQRQELAAWWKDQFAAPKERDEVTS